MRKQWIFFPPIEFCSSADKAETSLLLSCLVSILLSKMLHNELDSLREIYILRHGKQMAKGAEVEGFSESDLASMPAGVSLIASLLIGECKMLEVCALFFFF